MPVWLTTNTRAPVVPGGFGRTLAEVLDYIIFLMLMEFLEHWKEIEQLHSKSMKRIEEQRDQDDRTIQLLDKQKRSLTTRRQRLIDAIGSGVVSHDEANTQMDHIRQEVQTIDHKIQETRQTTGRH